MVEWTRARHEYTTAYIRDVFGRQDEHLARLMVDARAAGLPDIAVSADVGRLLLLLARTTAGKRAIEVGTLAGYSAIWLARGLADDGALTTIEPNEVHARFAEQQLAKAGVADKVRVVRGTGLEVLPRLAAELGPDSVDVLFFDAVKREYPDYWRVARPLLKRGGLLICDNVLGSSWWIDEEGNPDRDAVDAFNRAVAADPELDVACVPLREGVLVARRR